MTETPRKYDAQTTILSEMRLEPTALNNRKQKGEKSFTDIKKKQVFEPQVIFDLIKRIKDL